MRNRIDEVLKAQGKTYEDMASLTGLSDYAIGNIAHGRDDVTLGAWLSLARALHVSPAYLVGWSDEPSEDEHKHNIESSDAFKAYMRKVEPEPHYDFAKPEPSSGVKVTLDDGRVIYDSRGCDDLEDYSLHGDWLFLNDKTVAMKHIVSIEELEEDN